MLGQKTGIGVFREGQIEEKRKKERFSVDDKRSPTPQKGNPHSLKKILAGVNRLCFGSRQSPGR